MSNPERKKVTLIGDTAEIKTLLEWQQQRFHHLQNVSLALLSGFLTVLAILVTILTPDFHPFLSPPPTPKEIETFSTNSIFSYPGLSTIFGFGYILAGSLMGLSVTLGAIGIYKLYNIISSPPLRPNVVGRNVMNQERANEELLRELGVRTVQQELEESFHENQKIMKVARRDFKMALMRLPTALFIAHYAAQVQFHTTSLNPINALGYTLIIVLPTSILTMFTNKILPSTDEKDTTQASIGQEILDEDAGRFPDTFLRPERLFIVANNMLAITAVLGATLDLGAKFFH